MISVNTVIMRLYRVHAMLAYPCDASSRKQCVSFCVVHQDSSYVFLIGRSSTVDYTPVSVHVSSSCVKLVMCQSYLQVR